MLIFRLFNILIALLIFLPAAKAVEAPARIVSINLCADQYLLALADEGQIVALTKFARDSAISFHAERARLFPSVATSAEAIMELKPDLVLASTYRDADTKRMLRRFGILVEEIGRAETVPLMIEQTTEVSRLIGQVERGEKLVSALRATEIAPPATSPRKSALVYQRRGYVSGSGTIVAEMMRLAGVVNQAEQMGRNAVSHASLEEIVLNPPDYLIIEDMSDRPRDLGSELLSHPIFDRIISEDHIIRMPAALSVCGGPSFPAAVEALRNAVSGN